MARVVELKIDDAQIAIRNFSGKEGRYNREGERSFVLALPNELAEQLAEDGWNVRVPRLNGEEDGYERNPLLNVDLDYRFNPPKVVMISGAVEVEPGVFEGGTKEILGQDELSQLDWADIAYVDLKLRGREWDPGRIKARVKEIYITLAPNDLYEKYGI